MRKIIPFLLLLSLSASGQDSLLLKRWLPSVFNIDARPSNYDALRALREEADKGTISHAQLWKKLDSITKRGLGTAFILEYKKRRYLVTARHVVVDTGFYSFGDSNFIAPKIFLVESDYLNKNNDSIRMEGITILKNNSEVISLSLSNAGGPETDKSFIISTIDDDLAVIDLDYRDNKRFLKTLLDRGYIPIDQKYLDTKCDKIENKKIYLIGFPNESIRALKSVTLEQWHRESEIISTPVISYGTVLNQNDVKNYFEGGIFTYYGFSGGPVFTDGNLIGIVHGRELLIEQMYKNKRYVSFHSKFMKSSLIPPLIEKLIPQVQRLEKRDAEWKEMLRSRGWPEETLGD